MRERESIFLEYVSEVKKREKEEKSLLKEKVKITASYWKDYFMILFYKFCAKKWV